MKSLVRRLAVMLCCCTGIGHLHGSGISTLNKSDPYPLYSARDPYAFLSKDLRQTLRCKPGCYCGDYEWYDLDERFSMSFALYKTSADTGTQADGTKQNSVTVGSGTSAVTTTTNVGLGAVGGFWNIGALFYPFEKIPSSQLLDGTAIPLNKTFGIDLASQLGYDFTVNGTAPNQTVSNTCFDEFSNPIIGDVVKEQYGFINPQLQYRKWGVRFETMALFTCDFGLRLQTGVADILQRVLSFDDLTCGYPGYNCQITCPTGTATTFCMPNQYTAECKREFLQKVMQRIPTVAELLKVDVSSYHKAAMEDLNVAFFWRRLFVLNDFCCPDVWAPLIFTPFWTVHFVVPTGHEVAANNLFAIPTGNNGHWGYGMDAGMSFDFFETIQLGFDAGFTAWNTRDYSCFPVAVNSLQNGLLPIQAEVNLKPGSNWTFAVGMDAHNFIDRLSANIEYRIVVHKPDCFRVKRVYDQPLSPVTLGATQNPPNAVTITPPTPTVSQLVTDPQMTNSEWRVQFADVRITYDVTPNLSLGFVWQAPIKQKNAYKSSTVMGTIEFSF